MSVLRPRRVSLLFRVLAGALGPALAIAGIYMLGAAIFHCAARAICGGVGHWVVIALVCVGNIALGLLLLGTARTGEDPFVSDITEEEDEA